MNIWFRIFEAFIASAIVKKIWIKILNFQIGFHRKHANGQFRASGENDFSQSAHELVPTPLEYPHP